MAHRSRCTASRVFDLWQWKSRTPLLRQELAQVTDPPDRFYSVLDDLLAASGAAIDILLASAELERRVRLKQKAIAVVAEHDPEATVPPNTELLAVSQTSRFV